MTVGTPLSLYRHLRFCLGSLRAEINPAPTMPVYLFITPTYDGWHASVFISTSAVLSGFVAAGVNPAPTKPVYLFVLTQPFTVAPPTSVFRHLRFCRICHGRGKPRPYNSRFMSRLYQISVGARLVLARLSGLIRRSGGGKPRPYNNARLSGLTASTFFYVYLII